MHLVTSCIENKKTTSDGLYSIVSIGRLIIVKIEKPDGENEYEELKEAIKEHYSEDKRVHDVYINKGGTVAIDCRN